MFCRSPRGLVAGIGHCALRGKAMRSEPPGRGWVWHLCSRPGFKDDLMGSQADSLAEAFIHRGWPERHSLDWECGCTRSKQEAWGRGAGARREALAPDTKWQLLFIEHWCVRCSGRTLWRVWGLQHYLGTFSHGLVIQAKEGTSTITIAGRSCARFHSNTKNE